MKDQSWVQFKEECVAYLSTLNIGFLRAYAREVGVAKPTTKKKQRLLEEILAIFAGDLQPIPRATLGAPVKDSGVDIGAVRKEIERIHLRCYSEASGISVEQLQKTLAETPSELPSSEEYVFDFKKELARLRESNENVFRVADSESKKRILDRIFHNDVLRGQLEKLGDRYFLLPIDDMENDAKIVMPLNLIEANDLREGDIVSCYAERNGGALVATEVLTINERMKEDLKRIDFETAESCFATEKIKLFGKESSSLAMKYLDWLLPIGKGQRGFVVSAPKAGKSVMLYEVAQAALKNNRYLDVLVLLIEQPPESVWAFRKIISSENLIFATYEEEPEQQVFAANFLLKRAKRLAECGRDVLLLTDSLNALAYAYNDTTDSVGGRMTANGLESKTMQYLKKYFGSARCFKQEGSLTIFGTISTQTGNPSDDFIVTELSRIANFEIHLDEKAAAKRVYPAIDFSASRGKGAELLFTENESTLERAVRVRYEDETHAQELRNLLDDSDSYEAFAERVQQKG